MTRIPLPNIPNGVVCYVGTHRTPDGLWLDGFHIFTLRGRGPWLEVSRQYQNTRLKWVGVYSNAKTAAANARGLGLR